MDFKFLKLIWEGLQKLSPDILRLFVIILLMYVFVGRSIDGVKTMFNQENNKQTEIKQDREQYVTKIMPRVNGLIQDIASKDEEATNVLLLNYHNTLTSTHGLAYRYLTGICEQFKTKPCIDYWKELDYMNYGEEIHNITIRRCLLMQDVKDYRQEFPKFTYLLERSNAKSAIFYPIIGVDSSIGLIVVLYDKQITEISLDKIRKVIAPNIQPLAVLLDYNYVKDLIK